MRATGSDRGHYDAVVVGSGFGGAVAAHRLIRQSGLRVLLLERGMPYPPGSFPRTPRQMRANFWDPGAGLHGLLELWSFRRVRAVVSSGLGGGSLIYANVLLRKPAHTFGSDMSDGFAGWPVTAAELEDEYAEVEKALGANPVPDAYLDGDSAGGDAAVPKTRQFQAAAAAVGLTARRAPLAITFGAGGPPAPGVPFGEPNLHGRPRHSCTLVGECDLGCNEGAKNSLDYTYLDRFLREGGDRARIHSCCEAIRIEPAGRDGYRVIYAEHAAARAAAARRLSADAAPLLDPDTDERGGEWTRRVTARAVVVCGGTFGSTRLLLSSRPALARLSPQLGRRFSSNGDLLTFARGCRDGDGAGWRHLDPSRGPVITAYAEHQADGRGLWMEDAGGPLLSEWMWQSAALPRDGLRIAELALALARGRRGGRVSRLAARALGGTEASAAMLPLLTMGQDVSGGRLRLRGDGLALDWDPNGASERYFDAAQRLSEKFAAGLGGRLGPAAWTRRARGLTVHPLGGCPMGIGPDSGVVDSRGEVFGHPGLFVADGSIMPGPVGPNPSLTIAALGARVGAAAAARAAQ